MNLFPQAINPLECLTGHGADKTETATECIQMIHDLLKDKA